MGANPVEPRLSKYLHGRGKALGLPISGTFELTPRCNFNCRMCYVHLSAEEQRRRGQELSADAWLSIAEQAKKAGMVFLLLTGGEPLLRKDFPEIYRALKQMGFMITINSNGYLIEGDLLELFREEPPTRFNISLYGVSEETYRKMCGVPAYHRIVANINALRQAGIDVKINMSLTPENLEDMQAVYEAAKEMGIHTQASPYMFPPIRQGRQWIGKNERMSAERAGEFMTEYDALCLSEEDFCRHAMLMQAGCRGEKDDEACDGTPGQGVACRAGSSSFWLTWDGKMMPCGQMVEPAEDVLALGFDEAWRRIRQATAQIRLPSACTACALREICHACAAMCYCETGRFDGRPDYVCRMTKRFAETTQKYWQEELGGKIVR